MTRAERLAAIRAGMTVVPATGGFMMASISRGDLDFLLAEIARLEAALRAAKITAERGAVRVLRPLEINAHNAAIDRALAGGD